MCSVTLGDRVEELAVVADHDHRAGVALQPGFEPDQRVEVEVVGRLVEQQQVGRAHQRARQLQPHAPAAGEAVHRRVELARRLKAQAQQQRLRARRARRRRRLRRARGARRPIAWPSPAASAAASCGLRVASAACRPASTKSVAPLVGLGHLLRHLADAPARRHRRRRRRRRAAGRRAARTATTCRRRCGRPGRPSRRA